MDVIVILNEPYDAGAVVAIPEGWTAEETFERYLKHLRQELREYRDQEDVEEFIEDMAWEQLSLFQFNRQDTPA